ncbi:MAG: cobalamin biosynthesis protein CobD/CbiB [Candidatus Binataceae bacterium]
MSYAFHLPALAIIAAIVLDLLLGDPPWLPSPARLIGRVVVGGVTERRIREAAPDRAHGAVVAIGLVATSGLSAFALIALAASISEFAAAAAAVFIGWYTLSFRDLDTAARRVQRHLATGEIDAARAGMPALVGRDANSLTRDEMIRAAAESVAENASSRVIAPIFYLLLGGPVLAIAYKAVNTLESAIGDPNPQRATCGVVTHRINEIANFIPARVTAFCIAAAASTMLLRGRAALAACLDEAYQHEVGNSAWPIAAMAGALGLRLGGGAVYDGATDERASFGRDVVPPAIETIAAAREVMRSTVFIAFCTLALTRYILLLVV